MKSKLPWRDILIDARERGLTYNECAHELGLSDDRVRSASRYHGLRLKRIIPTPAEKEAFWAAHFAEAAALNEPINAFCYRVGCSQGAAASWARRLGYEFPRRKKTQVAKGSAAGRQARRRQDKAAELDRYARIAEPNLKRDEAIIALYQTPKVRKPHVLAAAEMVRSGATYGDAAKALGLTRGAVAGACNRLGVKKSALPRQDSADSHGLAR